MPTTSSPRSSSWCASVEPMNPAAPVTRTFIFCQSGLAERVGFEPTIRLRVFRFSRPARSTAPSPLRLVGFYQRGGSTRRFDGLESAHIRLQPRRDVHAPVSALIVLHDRDQGAPHRKPGTVQGVHQLGLSLFVAEARLHAPRLERLA